MSRYKMVALGTLIQQAKAVRCGDSNYPVLSMTMHDGLVFQDDKFKKIIASKDRSDYKVVKRNQLVISFPIDEGVLATQRIVDAGIVSPAYGIWDIDQETILPEFLEYALRCDRALSYYKAKLRGSTARRRSLPTPTLLAFTVPLPDISEQKHILEIIHKAKGLILKRTEEIALLDNLIKARFVELFGDPVSNPMGWMKEQLQSNATLLNGRAYKQDELLDSGKYPVLRVGNFFSNRSWYYSDLELDDEKYCDNGDLLYAWSASFGPRIWNGGKVIYHYHIWKVLVGENYNKQFLCNLLDYVTASLMGDTHGIGMMHLTKSGMEETEFIVPPIDLQNQFAAFVEQTDKSKVVVQKALDEAQMLFDSLMQKYFG